MKAANVIFCAAFLWLAHDARSEVVWQLGQFDESSAEFSPILDPLSGQRRIDYSDPKQDPLFVIGRSDPARHWFCFQPGSANGGAGFRKHPFTIEFELPEPPFHNFRLTLALLAYSTRLPYVGLDVNGHRGHCYQDPVLTYSAGDSAVFFLPHYAVARIECNLPASLLKQGLNRLVITPLDDPSDRDDVRPSGFPWPGCSGIVYDAVKLERLAGKEAEASVPNNPRVQVIPTVFYVEKEGRLHELIEVVVRLGAGPVSGDVALSIGGWTSKQALAQPFEFGEAKLVFETPEFVANTEATVRVAVAGKTDEWRFRLVPKKKWDVLVVPNEHLDVGYTDFDWKVSVQQARTVDAAIAMASAHPEFQFTFDGFWIVQEFLNNRSPLRRHAFLDLARDRRLHVPVVYGSTFTGFAGLENLIRCLYPSKRFSVEHGTPFDCALITDVPSYSWSLASVLSAAGVKYFAAASDAYRAPFLLFNRLHERSPQWWEGPDGGRVLTWYSRHYHQVGSLFGMPPQMAQGRQSLPRFLQAYDHPAYQASSVLLYGTQVENVALNPAQAGFVSEWNRAVAYPRLRYAGFAEAIAEIARESGDPLPVHRGDGGPYWEDGLGANARITSLARRNMQRVLSAETFSTIGAQLDTTTTPDRTQLARIWQDLLLTDEHSWHADQSVRDPESEQSVRQGAAKDFRTIDADRQIDDHLGRALAAIAQSTTLPGGSVMLFNTLAWPRRGLVELDLPKGWTLVDLRDGGAVQHESLFTGNGFQRVRFLSPELPAVGYRGLAMRPATQTSSVSESTRQTRMENRFYAMELDPDSGAIRSVVDKALDRELVETNTTYRFNQHLYVTGADSLPNRLVQYSTVAPLPELRIHRARGGRVLSVKRTPFGMVALMESTNVNTPRIETEIVLFDEIKRIEIVNRLQKTRVYSKEAVYFAFPFACAKPRFRYATQNGFVNPESDLLPGAGREWFTVQHWLSLEQDGLNIGWTPVDAPLVTLGDIARGAWPVEFGPRGGTVFSYAMNNYTPEGYQAGQGGDFTFRYVITSSEAFDPVALHRLGAEALSPIERNEITRNDKPFVPQPSTFGSAASFLDIESPNLSLVTWKMAERGAGTILRLVEVAGRTNAVGVRFSNEFGIVSATRCNAVEDDEAPLPFSDDRVEITPKPFGIITLRVRGR